MTQYMHTIVTKHNTICEDNGNTTNIYNIIHNSIKHNTIFVTQSSDISDWVVNNWVSEKRVTPAGQSGGNLSHATFPVT